MDELISKDSTPRCKTKTENWPTTILVVDDDNLVRLITAKMLGPNRKVFTASNGKEAIEIFKEHAEEIECVLLDVIMPELSGIQTYHELRKIEECILVMFMSGYCKERAIGSLLVNNQCGFINKPFRRRELNAKLKLLAENDFGS